MRKEIEAAARSVPAQWIDLEREASVRLTSEDPAHPIEAALRASGDGWRAAQPGRQKVTLHFEKPRHIRRVALRFEVDQPRTQEFALRYSVDNGGTFREVVRQQYNFSPGGASVEEEDYTTDLGGVTDLELAIMPDISGGPSAATLRWLRVA